MKQGGRRGSGPAVFGDARAMGGVCRHPLSAGIEGGSERARLDEEREMRRDSQTKERGGERENQIILKLINVHNFFYPFFAWNSVSIQLEVLFQETSP